MLVGNTIVLDPNQEDRYVVLAKHIGDRFQTNLVCDDDVYRVHRFDLDFRYGKFALFNHAFACEADARTMYDAFVETFDDPWPAIHAQLAAARGQE